MLFKIHSKFLIFNESKVFCFAQFLVLLSFSFFCKYTVNMTDYSGCPP